MAELINLKITYRLLQQNRPEADIPRLRKEVRFWGVKRTHIGLSNLPRITKPQVGHVRSHSSAPLSQLGPNDP
jgi:hypothetical protein